MANKKEAKEYINKVVVNTRVRKYIKRSISIVLIMAVILPLIQMSKWTVSGTEGLFDWRKNDIMDIGLDITKNKAGDDDVLLEIDTSKYGVYELSYFLEDGRKTTVEISNNYSELSLGYKIQELSSTGAALEVTQDIIDSTSYLEVDYSGTIPSWENIEDKTVTAGTQTLDYRISRSASSVHPGIAFKLNNKLFIAKWDFQSDLLYILFDGYEAGQIMPVHLKNPAGDEETIKILKGLENFEISPTYLIEDPDNPGTNIEKSPIVYPNDDKDKPGNRPGLIYSFKQPKELDETTWTYDYSLTDLSNIRAVFELSDIGTSDYLDFNMLLANNTDTRIYEIPDENGDQADPGNHVNYTYDASNYEYEIILVQDKSDLADQDHIIQWNDLSSSSIYNASVGFEILNATTMAEYEFASFSPTNNFAYTYLEYQIKRADQQEAFLEIIPYNVDNQDGIEYKILYSKIIAANLDPVNDLWLTHYQSEEDSGTINIPVEFNANSYQDAYQVIVKFSNTDLISQVLNYKASSDQNVPPTTPAIKSIENLYVVPPETDNSENPTKIQFDMVWDAIENRTNKELDDIFVDEDPTKEDAIYYEVLVNDIPDMLDSNPFQVFRVYEVYKDPADGLYKLRVHGNTTAEDEASDSTNYEHGYNDIDELFRMEKIVIYEDDLWAPRIDTDYDATTDTYTITERTKASDPTSFEADFEFPGVNYIRIRAITVKDGVHGISEYSVAKSLSLSMQEYTIPIVEGISYKPFYSIDKSIPSGIDLRWPAVDITNYESNMLSPVDKEATGITYRVYMSEVEEDLLNLDETNANYTEIETTPGGDVSVDEDTLNLLRTKDESGNGHVVYFELDTDEDAASDLESRITGLDENNTYYVRIVVDVQVQHIIDLTEEVRTGKPSSILNVTTPYVPEEPGDDEVLPLAPEDLIVDFLDDSELSTTLSWVIPEEVTIEEDTYGFEIFSLEDISLPDDLDNRDKTVSELLNAKELSNHKKEVWRIYYEDSKVVLKKYDEDTNDWTIQDASLIDYTDEGITIIDNDNAPNHVMYYYVRTINVKSGMPVKASSWIYGTITTTQVKGPINLIIVDDEKYKYDSGHEAVIRFDAPIPSTADLKDEYIMQIFVKGENDEDYTMAGVSSSSGAYTYRYLDSTYGPTGYQRLFYKIQGLESGTQYYIKIRIEDRTQNQDTLPDGTTSYPKSPYSDRVEVRTEFNQADYDREQKYEQYIAYYMKKVEAIRQEPYFLLDIEDDSVMVKYRYDFMEGLLDMNEDNQFFMYVPEKETSYYYIPSEMIESANDLNVTLVFQSKDDQVGIVPYSIGNVITDEIDKVKSKINEYDSNLEDYYVRIQLSIGEYEGLINNQKPSSDLIHIEVSIVGSEEMEDIIDLDMDDELDRAINTGKDELVDLLDKELESGISDKKLAELVTRVVKMVEEDFGQRGSNVFNGYLDTRVYTVSELEEPINIGFYPDDSEGSYSVYSKTTADWKLQPSTYYENRYVIYTKELGSYISVYPLGGDELKNLYSSAQIDIINKYKLTDVFTIYELTNGQSQVYNYQMVQVFSRLIGADDDTDTDDYLKDQGVDVPRIKEYELLNNEMAGYIYVQIYTIKHQMNLEAVTIKDYNAIEDIDSVTAAYKETLLKGQSLGVVQLMQNQILPEKTVTVKGFMRLISNIE